MSWLKPAKQGSIPRLPIVALIDVVLFILLFFVASADFSQQERDLASSLRSQPRGEGRSSLQPQVVTVLARGTGVSFEIGGRSVGDRAGLTAILRALNRDEGVFIKVHPDASVAGAAAALQAAYDAGFTRVTYVPL